MDRFEEIKGFIQEILGADPSTITSETNFEDDLNADSLDLVELAMAVEDHYGIEVSDEDLAKIKTVGDILEVLEKLLDESKDN